MNLNRGTAEPDTGAAMCEAAPAADAGQARNMDEAGGAPGFRPRFIRER